jgi:phosphoenolpyruvate carboxykinase (ATP)
MALEHTRSIIDAIHEGSLAHAETVTDPVFGLAIPTRCPGVPDEILVPERTWQDAAAYRAQAAELARRFHENFEAYAAAASEEIHAAGPAAPAAEPVAGSASR